MLSTLLVYQARTGNSTEPVTQADVDMAQPFWTLTGYALLVPIALAAFASIRLTRSAPRPRLGSVVTALWAVTVIACVAYSIAWHFSMHFTEPAHGDSSAAVAAQGLVRGGVIPLAFIATGLLAHQFQNRIVVGICAVLAIGWIIALAFGVHLPPALLVVAWIPLGIQLLRRARTSGTASATPAP